MKKTILLTFAAIICAVYAFAQTPQSIKYQAVLRDNAGEILSEETIDIRISIEGTGGTAVYQENHATCTNQYGIVNLNIGNGSLLNGNFGDIDWAAEDHFIRIEVDNGSGYVDMGLTQLLSVPYAFYANTAAEVDNFTEMDPVFDVSPAAGITATDITDWTTAYNWGNHADAGYLTEGFDGNWSSLTGTPPVVSTFANDAGYLTEGFDGNWSSLTGTPPVISTFANDAGYIDAESDPSWTGAADTAAGIWRYGSVGIGTSPSIYDDYKLHIKNNTEDEQTLVYVYRSYDNYGPDKKNIYARRNGTFGEINGGDGYGNYDTDVAISGYSYYGNNYTFGVHGANYNDYDRCGGVIGSNYSGTYWGSLGYTNSGGTNYGGYFTSSTTGVGFNSTGAMAAGIGYGGYGDMLGSWSRGEVAGQIVTGELFSSYNLGNTYTSGTQVELVNTGTEKTAAYSVTSREMTVYDKGFASLSGNEVEVSFDRTYSKLLADERPVVTITPVGQSGNIYIKSITTEGFVVASDAPQNIEFSWIAVGKRVDSEQAQQVPENLKSNEFDQNLRESLFNDGIKSRDARSLWWDGNRFRFGNKIPDVFKPQGPKEKPERN